MFKELPFIVITEAGVDLLLYIQPGAKKSEFVGRMGERMKLRINAPPVDGKANESIIAFVAKVFQRPRRDISIVSGQSSRRKTIRIQSLGIDELTLWLEQIKPLLQEP